MSTPDSGSRESKDWMGRAARIVEHFGVCLRPGIQIQRLNKQFVQGSGVKPKFAGTFGQREDGICRYKFAVGRWERHCRRDPVWRQLAGDAFRGDCHVEADVIADEQSRLQRRQGEQRERDDARNEVVVAGGARDANMVKHRGDTRSAQGGLTLSIEVGSDLRGGITGTDAGHRRERYGRQCPRIGDTDARDSVRHCCIDPCNERANMRTAAGRGHHDPLAGTSGQLTSGHNSLDRGLHASPLRACLCGGTRLDLVEEFRAVWLELRDVTNPEAVRQVVEQSEASSIAQLDRSAQFVRQAGFSGHRARRGVAADSDDISAVVSRCSPGDPIADRPKLSADSIEHQILDSPGIGIVRVGIRRKPRQRRGKRLPPGKSMCAAPRLRLVFLPAMQHLKQAALQFVVINERTAGAQLPYKGCHHEEVLLLGRVLHHPCHVSR
jgi:hypothetical protein